MRIRAPQRVHIVALFKTGMKASDIARRLGISRENVNVQLYTARQKGELPRTFPSTAQTSLDVRLKVNGEVLDQLKFEAGRRKMSHGRLINKLLSNIVKDNLFDAVLES